jgi:hypothetical protein
MGTPAVELERDAEVGNGPAGPPRGFLAELRDGVTPRAAALVVGVLAIQLGFIASYLGAFHHPKPYHIAMAVAVPAQAPAGTAERLVAQLNGIAGTPVEARTAVDEAAARRLIDDREIYGALIVSGAGTTDRLLVAGAAGASVSSALTQVLTQADQAQQRQIIVDDIKPAGIGDARGLAVFYLAIGWVVGGYLVATALSTSKGARPTNPHRAVVRLGALAVYAVVSGLGGAIITETILSALTGSFFAVWWFGALLVFAAGAFTMGLQALTGMLGIGLTVLLFVVLGNPSAGGAYAPPLLPPFWRAIGEWLPPGAGTTALRGIVYFDGAGATRPSVLLAAYALVGAVATYLAALRHPAHRAAKAVESSVA